MSAKWLDDVHEYAAERMRVITANREAFIEAFLAEVGCMPSEAELCEETTTYGTVITTRVWLRRRVTQ